MTTRRRRAAGSQGPGVHGRRPRPSRRPSAPNCASAWSSAASRSQWRRPTRRTRSSMRWISRWSRTSGGRPTSPPSDSPAAISACWTSWAIRPTAATTARSAWPARWPMIRPPRPGAACRKPTVLVARLTCDCIQQVFSQWAENLQARSSSRWRRRPGRSRCREWFRHSRNRWEEVYGETRIELLAQRDARPDRAAGTQDRTSLRDGAPRSADGAHQRAGNAIWPKPPSSSAVRVPARCRSSTRCRTR